MISSLEIKTDKKGNIQETPSAYSPSDKVKNRTKEVMRNLQDAWEIRNRPFEEFNNLSLIQRLNIQRQSFNQYIFTEARDASDDWKSRAFRPIVRNKIMSIAAHITAGIIYPKIYAQNDKDMEDKGAAMVMRDILDWVNEQSEYDKMFMDAVINALVDPISIVHTEYAEKYRNIKEYIQEHEEEYTEEYGENESQEEVEEGEKPKKKWKVKKVLDELYSGFKDTIILPDELFIADPYEPELQRQPYLFLRKVVPYENAYARYGENELFKEYVRAGIQVLYSDVKDVFYEVYDDDLTNRMVEEITYWDRESDLKLTFVNGILLDDADTPNPRKDKLYPLAKTGYEKFNSRFFYYKSLADKLGPDEEVVNTLYRMIIDGTYLQTMPPGIVFGSEEISSDVIAPGVVTTISTDNPNASFQTIQTNNNLTAAMRTIEKVEASIGESSVDDLQSGKAISGSQTAFEISRLEQNARVMFGQFAKMIGFMVRDLGKLKVGDILQYATVGQVLDVTSEQGALRFKNFVLPEKPIRGRTGTKVIRFDGDLPDEMTEDEVNERSMEIYAEEEKLGNNTTICYVNPSLFRKIKYMVKVVPESLFPKSDALKKALALEAYALLMNNPLTNKDAVTRDLALQSFDETRDDPDRYIMEQQEMPIEGQSGAEDQVMKGASKVMQQEGQNTLQELAGKL
jgi:hypothetical protein